MKTKKVYAVLTYIPWDKITADGKGLVTEGVGNGFLPVFESPETAERKFPGHVIAPIEMEVEDDPEVPERPDEGEGSPQ